jgi:hypothetical protein
MKKFWSKVLLADLYGVDPGTVHDAINRKTWRHVE